jgi:hypothetical protein
VSVFRCCNIPILSVLNPNIARYFILANKILSSNLLLPYTATTTDELAPSQKVNLFCNLGVLLVHCLSINYDSEDVKECNRVNRTTGTRLVFIRL